MKVEGGRMTEIGEMIPQRNCSGRDAGGHDADERISIHVTEFAAQSNGSIHHKAREERKAHPQKSLNSVESIRTGTRIGRMNTDPGAQRQEKAPEHGDAMIVCLPRNNKPQIKSVYKIFKDADITLISPGM
jgi:hypothetical protein